MLVSWACFPTLYPGVVLLRFPTLPNGYDNPRFLVTCNARVYHRGINRGPYSSLNYERKSYICSCGDLRLSTAIFLLFTNIKYYFCFHFSIFMYHFYYSIFIIFFISIFIRSCISPWPPRRSHPLVYSDLT